jgi:hypothetical protein
MVDFEFELHFYLIRMEMWNKIEDIYGYGRNEINSRRSESLSRKARKARESYCPSSMVFGRFFDCLFSRREGCAKGRSSSGGDSDTQRHWPLI